MSDYRNLISSGVYALLDDLRSNVDTIDRLGVERKMDEERVFRGKLSHYSISTKKLEMSLIFAILGTDTRMRWSQRNTSWDAVLGKRKKRKVFRTSLKNLRKSGEKE